MREVVFANHGTIAKLSSTPLTMPEGIIANSSAPSDHIVRTLALNLWLRVFGQKLSEEDLDIVTSYATFGGACILGESAMKVIDPISKLAMGESVLEKVTAIRSRAKELAAESPMGRKILEAAAQKIKVGAWAWADGAAGSLRTLHPLITPPAHRRPGG